MLDPLTGNLRAPDGSVIGPGLSRTAFLESPIGSGAKPYLHAGSSSSYSLRIGGPRETGWVLGVRFDDERLVSIDVCSADERFGTSWDDVTPGKQEAHRRYLEEWLTESLGSRDREFPWGRIFCGMDPKGGFVVARILYPR